MGEYEATIERLNKVLTENGFSKVNEGVLSPYDNFWHSVASIPLDFDKTGAFIKPEKTT
jgi:hypothetical protein